MYIASLSKLSYIDNGYYKKPTGWTVVSEEPEWPNSSVIYFVCPDYVLDTIKYYLYFVIK